MVVGKLFLLVPCFFRYYNCHATMVTMMVMIMKGAQVTSPCPFYYQH
jgi:hypothetical protein